MGRLLAPVLTAVLIGHASYASPLDDVFNPTLGTLWVKAEPSFRNGELDGCTLQFAVIAKDFVYRRGAFVAIGGSVGLLKANRNVAATLKVVVQDIDPQTGTLMPNAPSTAYFVSGFQTTKDALISQTPSDTPGGLFAIFDLEKTFPVMIEQLQKSEITIAFARKPGGSDVQFTVDPTVVDTTPAGQRTRSGAPILDFTDCNSALLKPLVK